MLQNPRGLRQLTDAFTRRFGITGWSQSLDPSPPLRRLINIGVVVAVVLAVGQGLLHLVNLYALDQRITLANADADESLAGWTGTAAAAAAVLPLALSGLRQRSVYLLALAAGIAFLSFDDMLVIHERIHTADGTIGPIEHGGRLAWTMAYAPFVAVLFAGLWTSVGHAPAAIRQAVRGGGIALGAAIAMEALSPDLFELGLDHGAVVYEIEVALEEGLETAGWLAMAWAFTVGLLGVERLAEPRPAVPT